MLAYPAFTPWEAVLNQHYQQQNLAYQRGLVGGVWYPTPGNGCTSGHGVCRGALSLRSIIATCTFISAGMATVALMNLIGGAL